ncbi:MAG: DUF1015 domain-containing protein [Eubacteriales bacterium]|nr:DUF1015 domain-containing protein [Eubacteriales bacterium]
MANIKNFKALRPSNTDNAKLISALPYDVYDSESARAEVANNPYSFLAIDRAETLLPVGTDIYSDLVYEKATHVFNKMIDDGIFIRDIEACYYIYSLCMDGRTQTGLVACTAVDDYLNGICKKHENTVLAKENDRIKHVRSLKAQTGPIFLTYKNVKSIDEIISKELTNEPIYDFTAEDGIRHTVWKISNPYTISLIGKEFSEKVPYTYIADGHHRAAAAVKNALELRGNTNILTRRSEETSHVSDKYQGTNKNPCTDMNQDSDKEYDYFLSILFPDNELMIMDYNRVINDLNGLTATEILEKLSRKFKLSVIEEIADGIPERKPEMKGHFHIYLDKIWYEMSIRDEVLAKIQADVIDSLDVSIIQNYVLEDLFDISDPRTDKRVNFVGGIKGIKVLKEMADKANGMAISMFPTSIYEIMVAADQNKLMPPKSTWFEPKLRSGLLIHTMY